MFIHRLNAVRSALNLPWVGNGIIKPRGLRFHDILDEMDRVAHLRTRAIGFSIPPYQDIAPVNQPAKLTPYPVSPWVPVGARLARLERHVFGDPGPYKPSVTREEWKDKKYYAGPTQNCGTCKGPIGYCLGHEDRCDTMNRSDGVPYHWLGAAAEAEYPTLRPGMDF